MSTNTTTHIPVLLNETIGLLNIQSNGFYIDCTFGRGGHSKEILKHLGNSGKLLCVDRDLTAEVTFRENFHSYSNVSFIKSRFSDVRNIIGNSPPNGIVADIGVSSPQFDDENRGFSYHKDAPLDMRMDTSAEFSASDIVNSFSENEVSDILFRYGEEKFARKIARNIVLKRDEKIISSTTELAEIIASSYPAKFRKGAHPARQTFQALRIAVNDELGELETLLREAPFLLGTAGRLAIITFHSLEDRLVKRRFNELSEAQNFIKITKKPITPSEQETELNPRSRSAKLRVIERVNV